MESYDKILQYMGHPDITYLWLVIFSTFNQKSYNNNQWLKTNIKSR